MWVERLSHFSREAFFVAAAEGGVRLRSSRKFSKCDVSGTPRQPDSRLLRPNADRAERRLRQLLQIALRL